MFRTDEKMELLGQMKRWNGANEKNRMVRTDEEMERLGQMKRWNGWDRYREEWL